MTADLIALSQSGDTDATLELVNKFNPLLRKYAFNLNFDDAYDDLLLDFLEILNNVHLNNLTNCSEGILVSYIHKSLFNSYIKESKRIKKLRNIMLNSELSDSELYYIEALRPHYDSYNELDKHIISQILTKPESIIIKMLYFSDYSVAETARLCGVSRQAVNQTKNRALKKLRDQYRDKLVN